jgi:phospholipase A1
MKSGLTEVVDGCAAQPRRPVVALLFAGALALPGPEALAQPAGEISSFERCLLERLRDADPDTTAAQIRSACADVVAPLADQPAAPEMTSAPVERRIVSESRIWGERFALLPHRPNYLLPYTHVTPTPGSTGGPVQRNEIKFQLSFKLPLTPPLFEGRSALFFAYTGQAWWQAYNAERSSPFREYSHEPEIFAAWRPSGSLLGWTPRLATAGFVHQSNGNTNEFSRSWNRLFAELTLDRHDGWWLALRPWWRIPEDPKSSPDVAEGDDNPDISQYVGDGEIRLGYAAGEHRWTATVRGSLRNGGKGSVQLDWSRPTGFSPQLRWYVQYFDGYGESLIDYRTHLRRIGFGVMLNDWY